MSVEYLETIKNMANKVQNDMIDLQTLNAETDTVSLVIPTLICDSKRKTADNFFKPSWNDHK